MASIIPTTSVEFETLTTEPSWGDANEVDLDIKGEKTKQGLFVKYDELNYWKLLGIFTRDFRLGNISHRVDDIEYLEDMTGLAHTLLNLRGGFFTQQAWIALQRTTSTLEISQSRSGFMRKNARSVHQTGESITEERKKSGFNPFGKNNR